MAFAPGRLVARSFRQDCGVEPIQARVGIGRLIPQRGDDRLAAAVIVHVHEPLAAFDQREDVEIVQGAPPGRSPYFSV